MKTQTLKVRWPFGLPDQPFWLPLSDDFVGQDELDELRRRINGIKSERQIDRILETGNLLPLLKSVATMEHEDQVLYAMAVAEPIQKLEGAKSEAESAKQDREKHAMALPSWFKGLIDKVEEILDLIKKLRPIG